MIDRPRPSCRLPLVGALLLLAVAALGGSRVAAEPYDFVASHYVDVLFEIEQETTFGDSVFVRGDIAELGNLDVTRAIRLSPRGSYPIWRATIRLPRGRTIQYNYILRADGPGELPNAGNATPIGGMLVLETPPVGSEASRVRITAMPPHSFTLLEIVTPSGSNASTPLDILANGAGVATFARSWQTIQWYLTNPSLPVSPTFFVTADRAYYQGSAAFDYPPPASPSARRIVVLNNVASAILGNTRSVRVYLPRGYDQNTGLRYPVLYMHDGQNIFPPGGPFGTWAAESSTDAAIAENAIPEIIIVGIDNSNDRLTEYTPPYSTVLGQQGRGDLYTRFLVEEVMPLVESQFRVAREPALRGVCGSSLGGLISLYIGWERPDVFGRVASLSGSFWIGEIITRVETQEPRAIRIYLDSGNAGNSNDSMTDTNDTRDALLNNGYVLGRNLFHTIGYGHEHNEAAWRARFPGVLRAMWPEAEFSRRVGDVNGDGEGPDIGDLVAAVNVRGGAANAPTAAKARAQTDADGSGALEASDVAAYAAALVGMGELR